MNEFQIIEGDALDALRLMPAEYADSMVTDPPAGISFMGKAWDSPSGVSRTGPGVGQVMGDRHAFIAGMAAIFAEAHRVLKPGAHALVWALPRTSHWTATALEDAGFEIRDVVVHLFGTGFPKSLDVSKAIDKAAGVEREVIGRNPNHRDPDTDHHERWNNAQISPDITAPATDAGRAWAGWGTALKPAAEHWILCRKPLVGTVAANVTEHGCGAINVDGCRIGTSETLQAGSRRLGDGVKYGECTPSTEYEQNPAGRWPANVVLSHTPECKDNCAPGCPVRLLDEQSGESASPHIGSTCRASRNISASSITLNDGTERSNGYGDTGTASRFFYCAKPSTAERNVGLYGEGRFAPTMGNGIGGKEHDPQTATPKQNHHPTVKAAELMQYFCRLVTPPGGTVLDPFCGSGSTGIAALREGFAFVGIEREAEYAELARQRIKGDGPLLNHERDDIITSR